MELAKSVFIRIDRKMNLFYCVDMKKLLAEFAKQIKNEMPYFENKKLATELVVDTFKKIYGKSFTDKIEANFREQALFE